MAVTDRDAGGDGEFDPDAVRRLHDHLAATGERPVETPASHYLGEAEAVVADALDPDASDDVVRRRLEQARDLLDHVDGTGDDEADERVAESRRVLKALLAD